MNHGRDDEMLIGLPAVAEAVGTARRSAQQACLVWRMSPQRSDDVVLIVSEFATNAVRHSGGAFRVTLRHEPHYIRIEVEDSTACPPSERLDVHGPMAESGRGLLLVDEVASSWGCHPLPAGKRMWAVVNN